MTSSQIILIIIIIIIITITLIIGYTSNSDKTEKMTIINAPSMVIEQNKNGLCNNHNNHNSNDKFSTYLRHEYNMPDNPLIQKGQFSERIIPSKNTNELDAIQRKIELNKTPGYYIKSNGKYDDGNLSLCEAKKLICKSKMDKLYEQHNHIQWTPHTHIGKSRGYLNWATTY